MVRDACAHETERVMKQKLFLTFPQQVLNDPLLYVLGRDFKVIPNIKGATITEQMGMMAVELDGEADEIEKAVGFLRSQRVKVEVIHDGP